MKDNPNSESIGEINDYIKKLDERMSVPKFAVPPSLSPTSKNNQSPFKKPCPKLGKNASIFGTNQSLSKDSPTTSPHKFILAQSNSIKSPIMIS